MSSLCRGEANIGRRMGVKVVFVSRVMGPMVTQQQGKEGPVTWGQILD